MTHLQYTDENEPSASEHPKPPIRAARQRTRLVLVDDDEDFVAELSMDDDVNFNTGSVAGELHAEEIVKILTETDVYVKY